MRRPQQNDEELQSLQGEVTRHQIRTHTHASRESLSAPKLLGIAIIGIVGVFIFCSVVYHSDNVSGADLDAAPGHVHQAIHIAPSSTDGDSPVSPEAVPATPKETVAPSSSPSSPLPAATIATSEYPTTSPLAAEPQPTAESMVPPPNVLPGPGTTVHGDEAGGQWYVYTRRGQPMTDNEHKEMTEKWGSWTLVDDKERPSSDFYAHYPNRDIPRQSFPENAWQIDNEYLDKFLPQAIALVERAQLAILEEYGFTDGTWEERTKMFHLEIYDTPLEEIRFPKEYAGDQGGWTTQRSWAGLKRRLLHAIMSQDIFVFAMGGHSAAAGHGNHFQQSYTLQVQWILEAVFSRLGVRHQARNFGNGGLGTLHNAIAAGSIYGPDVDFLMWDSSMTEKEKKAVDVFARQALMGGSKVPVLWSLFPDVMAPLHDRADVDVGVAGTGLSGITLQSTFEETEAVPWAAQYVLCTGDVTKYCRENEYIGTCWIEREDVTPPTKQGTPGGRASWHPGNRKHQVTGRVLAFTLLTALKEVLTDWNDADGHEIADEDWHVTQYYNNIRTKLSSLEGGACMEYSENDLDFVCKYPMKARTEFTPRAFPGLTNIRTLLPTEQAALINAPEQNLYSPPDVFNPALHPPPGEIDVLNIVENGVEFTPVFHPDYTLFYKKPLFSSPPAFPLGKGVSLDTVAGDEFCDGSVDSFCNRGTESSCLLYGHNDGRNGLKFDSLSGWISLQVPQVVNGLIVIKLECWHPKESVAATDSWTSVNNGNGARDLTVMKDVQEMSSRPSSARQLKQPPPEYCDDFQFHYAIDGKVTTLSKDAFLGKKQDVQRVVETLTLLRDPEYTGGTEKEVEVALRMSGCGRNKVFKLTHIYWS